MVASHNLDPPSRARLSLEGLSLGDAFGECFLGPSMRGALGQRSLPEGPWFYTDDTIMAWSIVDVLTERGGIDQDHLACLFASRFRAQPNRGYGAAAAEILERIALGFPWDAEASRLFGGAGSMGNGAAMRAAPVGAYFADDLDRVVAEARASAAVTHAHPEGQAGSIAVAVGAATAWRGRGQTNRSPKLLEQAFELTPDGATRRGLSKALRIGIDASVSEAAAALGSGQDLLASDTVPFALWCAARYGDNFEEALWRTASGLGDVDTTCAIVGGIVSLSLGYEGLPTEWLRRREPLEE